MRSSVVDDLRYFSRKIAVCLEKEQPCLEILSREVKRLSLMIESENIVQEQKKKEVKRIDINKLTPTEQKYYDLALMTYGKYKGVNVGTLSSKEYLKMQWAKAVVDDITERYAE